MSLPEFENTINLLKEFTVNLHLPIEIILVGGISLQYYGMKDRTTNVEIFIKDLEI